MRGPGSTGQKGKQDESNQKGHERAGLPADDLHVCTARLCG